MVENNYPSSQFKIEISRQQIWDMSVPYYVSWCPGHSPTKTAAYHATAVTLEDANIGRFITLWGYEWEIHTKITKWQPNQLPVVVWQRIRGTSSVSRYLLHVFLFYCPWPSCANRFHWNPQELIRPSNLARQDHDDMLRGPVFQSCILRWSAQWNQRHSFHEKDSSKSMVSA